MTINKNRKEGGGMKEQISKQSIQNFLIENLSFFYLIKEGPKREKESKKNFFNFFFNIILMNFL